MTTSSEIDKEIRGIFKSYYRQPDYFPDKFVDQVMALIDREVQKARIDENRRFIVLAEQSGNPSDTITLQTLHTTAMGRVNKLGGFPKSATLQSTKEKNDGN